MPESQINEIFSYFAKDGELQGLKIKQIFTEIFKESDPHSNQIKNLTKNQFADIYKKSVKGDHIQDDLLFLFYHLDKQKKGYLSPRDVMGIFQILGKKITINEIQNSFKYAKVFKNKMSFQDFKEYFYNF